MIWLVCVFMFQVLSFFFVCLWMVPFGFFISLSANDMVLPTIGEDGEELGREGGGREGGREGGGERERKL